jgi:transcriptional regulator with XRE-family HTH domain
VNPDAHEAARRVRAARGYARLTREQLARKTELSLHQLKLLEDGKRAVTTRDELLTLGRACGVPDAFMEVGFSGVQEVYDEMVRVFAVVLSGHKATIDEKARELGVDLDKLNDPPGPNPADGVARLR